MADRLNSPWRELATAIFAPPAEGKLYGLLDYDVSEALRFLEARRGQKPHLTITHLVVASLGRALARDVPELNCFVRRGRVVARPRVDVMLAAKLVTEQGVAALVIRDADRKPLAEIAREVQDRASSERRGERSATNQTGRGLARVPWPLRRPLVRGLAIAVHEFGLELPRLGLTGQSFGSVLLTNIGSFGLSSGMLALMPIARLPVAIAMGRVEDKPVVRDGAVVVRPMLPVTGTFDHRLVDGEQIGRLASAVGRYLEKPELLESEP